MLFKIIKFITNYIQISKNIFIFELIIILDVQDIIFLKYYYNLSVYTIILNNCKVIIGIIIFIS